MADRDRSLPERIWKQLASCFVSRAEQKRRGISWPPKGVHHEHDTY
jgi:hypothetical protein